MLNVILLLGISLFASDGRLLLNPNLIPKNGEKIEDFVPKGWKIEQQIEGDLNQDSLPDAVVQLIQVETTKDKNGVDLDTQRALLILLKTKDEKFSRVAVANKLLQCVGCGGMLGYGGTGADLKIKNGVLIVSQLTGSREMVDFVNLFRFDSIVSKFYLIGEDRNKRDRATGDSSSVSTNYLTGKQIIEVRKFNQKLDREILVSKKSKSVPKKQQSIEDIDFEQLLLK